MRITLLGHASLYIETADVRVLVDPVLIDPHQENLFEVFPRREVNWDKLPPFEILFVSHQHLDHFDVATLSRLPRDVQVIIPEDALLLNTFKQLGFDSVFCVRDYYTFEVGSSRFLVTPSEATPPEHGLLVTDPSGAFWNQVDTVPSAEQVERVLAKSPAVDLMLATWQPMLELDWQYNRPVNFPWNTYGRLLEITRQIGPKALAPGSNGYRYTGSSAWMNGVVFPQTRERYMQDVQKMIPALQGRVFEFDPGDIFELVDGEPVLHRRASDFISSEERDPFELEFNPATAQRPFRDYAEDAHLIDRREVQEFVERAYANFLNAQPRLLRHHTEWRVIYQLEVAYADQSDYWWADFSAPEISFQKGRNPLANFSCGVTASGLMGLAQGTGGWDSVALAGNYYQIHRVYDVWERGLVLPGVVISNPLHLMFLDEEVTERLIQRQIERALALSEERAGLTGPAGSVLESERKEAHRTETLSR